MIIHSKQKEANFFITFDGNQISYSGDPSAFLGYTLSSDKNQGLWAKWKWENETFEFSNDRFGFYPIYYFKTDKRFGISTSILDLLRNGAPKEICDKAISVFIRLGFFIGNDTPFKEIKAVAPGSKIIWKQGNLEIQSNKDYFKTDNNNISLEEAIDVYGKLFQSTMEKLLPTDSDKVILPLSGGRDSRHMLFAMMKAGFKPDCCVNTNLIPPFTNEDTRVSTIIAKHFKLPLVVLKQTNDLFSAELRKNLMTSFGTDEACWALPIVEYLQNNDYTLLYEGTAGGIFSSGAFQNEQRIRLYNAREFKDLAVRLYGSEFYYHNMLKPHYYNKWNHDLAVSHIESELIKYINTPNPVGQFYFWNRTRREISLCPFNLLNATCNVITPFMDHEFLDFELSLPVSYFLDHTFHTKAIEKFYPEYAGIEYGSKNAKPAINDASNIRTFIRNITPYFLSSKFIKKGFLLRRVLKGLLSNKYGTKLHLMFVRPIYLEQLIRFIKEIDD